MKSTPVIHVVGYSGSGKTTLLSKLIHHFRMKGFRIAAIKHHGHHYDLDTPGKDTWHLRKAGADVTLLVSGKKMVRMEESSGEILLNEALNHVRDVDIVFVEGFKYESTKKLLVISKPEEMNLINSLENVIGVISWFSIPDEMSMPIFMIDEIDKIAQYVEQVWLLEGREWNHPYCKR
jgi:molybdopterin-guanine dinucleotide biosynthesis protein B